MTPQKNDRRPNRGKQARKSNIKGIYRFGYLFGKVGFNLVGKPSWSGIENLPEKGPYIIAPNHISNVDPPFLGCFLADNGIRVRFLAKADLFKWPVIGFFVKNWGMIPVSRGSKNAGDSLKHARQALRDGDVVGVYYEGTLTRDPAFWPMKGKTGLARLALDTRVPIIPVAQWGAQDVMDRYTRLRWGRPRPEMVVKVLPPLDYSDIEGDSTNWEGVEELTRRLQKTLAAGVAEIRRQEAPETVWDMKKQDGPNKARLKGFSKWRIQLAKTNRVQDILPAQLGFER